MATKVTVKASAEPAMAAAVIKWAASNLPSETVVTVSRTKVLLQPLNRSSRVKGTVDVEGEGQQSPPAS